MKKNKKQNQESQTVERCDVSFNEVMAQIRANRKKTCNSNVAKGSKKSGKR